jgi:hypothetical protein
MPENFTPPALRVRTPPYEEVDRTLNYILDPQHRWMEAGHSVGFSPKCLLDLGRDVKRVARMAKEIEADAWLIRSGTQEMRSTGRRIGVR